MREIKYDPANDRLVYLADKPTKEYWDSLWTSFGGGVSGLRNSLRAAGVEETVRTTQRFLRPSDGRILEGGCGLGGKVASLANSGFEVIGVDFAEETIGRLNSAAPEYDFRLGDVRELQFDDDSFLGYWSIGVIEHFWSGYQDIFLEMKRVLKPGGFLFLSFPYLSPFRRRKIENGGYEEILSKNEPENFYQFALNHHNVSMDLSKMGFNCLETVAYAPYACLRDEEPRLMKIVDRMTKVAWAFSVSGKLWHVLVFRLVRRILSPRYGHCVRMVFRHVS